MRVFGSFLGAAVLAGAGLVYYVHHRHQCSGAGYLDVVRQLPGDVQRAGDEVRRRATEAVERGRAAARDRDAELARRLTAAGPSPVTPGAAPAGGPEPSAA